MNGEIRRSKIENILKSSAVPVPGVTLAKDLDVSRQIIVSDIALLRANGLTILSTNKGYMIPKQSACQRVFKVIHADDQVGEELSLIVDNGGVVKDVFVYHKVYGVVRADMNIRTRRDVKKFLEGLSTGSSSLLKNVTGGYHYHTIEAESEEILDDIQNELAEKGFLMQSRRQSGISGTDALIALEIVNATVLSYIYFFTIFSITFHLCSISETSLNCVLARSKFCPGL